MHHENEKMALFEALYREYLVPLKKYAYRIGVGYDDIEDMVHEAFIEYYKRYSLDLDHKVKLVLLIRILRSKWIDNRRQMRRREMLHLEESDAEEEIMNLLLEGEIGIQLLDQEVIDRDIYWNVWKIVKSMKKDWRDVLILRVLEGLTAEEACAVLKIKSTVCCTRLYRAKAELQKRVLRAKLFDI